MSPATTPTNYGAGADLGPEQQPAFDALIVKEETSSGSGDGEKMGPRHNLRHLAILAIDIFIVPDICSSE